MSSRTLRCAAAGRCISSDEEHCHESLQRHPSSDVLYRAAYAFNYTNVFNSYHGMIMSDNASNFHAISRGRYVGIVKGLNKLKQYIDGYEGAMYRSFSTFKDAQNYLESILKDNVGMESQQTAVMSACRKRKLVDDTSNASFETLSVCITSGSSLNPIIIEDEDPLILNDNQDTNVNFIEIDDDDDVITVDDSQDDLIVIDDDDDEEDDASRDDDYIVCLGVLPPPKVAKKAGEYFEKRKKWMERERRRARLDRIFLNEYSMLVAPIVLESNNKPYFHAILFFDGGFRSAHRIAGAGAHLRVVKSLSDDSSLAATPNISIHNVRWYSNECWNSMIAEYNGLIQGLMALIPLLQEFLSSITEDSKSSQSTLTSTVPSVRIQIYGDCQEVIRPILNKTEVRVPHLQVLHNSCVDMVHAIQQYHQSVHIRLRHIYRKHNTIADGRYIVCVMDICFLMSFVYFLNISHSHVTKDLQTKP